MRPSTPGWVVWIAWLACSPRQAEESAPPPMATLSGIRMQYFQGAELTAAGSAAQVIYERSARDIVAADVILHFPSRKEQPSSPGPAVGGMEIKAPTVTGNLSRKQADGQGGVVLRTGSGMLARTDRAHFDGVAMKATGKDPVWVQGPGHWVTAGEFSAQIGEETFEFGGHVQTRLGSPP